MLIQLIDFNTIWRIHIINIIDLFRRQCIHQYKQTDSETYACNITSNIGKTHLHSSTKEEELYLLHH